MIPVAMFRRASLLLAPACCALLLAGPLHAGNDPLTEASAEPASHVGLKASTPVRRFKSEELPEDVSAVVPEDSVAPSSVDRNDYSLRGSISSGGGLVLQKGVASWYGKMFHGRKTSSGDPYDMYAMTAAHPSLPIPSYVRVTNLSNGRSAVVRVNDRGPFHPGRIIDLSYAAAYKLGYVDQGQANVEVALVLPEDVSLVRPGRPVPPLRKAKNVASAPVVLARQQPASSSPAVAALGEAPRPVAVESPSSVAVPVASVATQTADKSNGPVFLQLATFPSLVVAEAFKSFVEDELKWLKTSVSVGATGGRYRLRIGPFPSALEARSISERIAGTLKLKPFVVQP